MIFEKRNNAFLDAFNLCIFKKIEINNLKIHNNL